MPANEVTQYTIRGIPLEVDDALRKRARQRRISLNRLVVEELTLAAGESPRKRYRSLESLKGRWKPDPKFDRIIAEQHRIDDDMWR